jgi:S-methylmethionine-dependent homocysteine/selenocysteine methylase
MSYRTSFAQLIDDRVFLTDGGLETDLLFNQGIDLPHFAACALLRSADGRETLRRYFTDYATVARDSGLGLILDTVTWRANPDWIEKLGLEPSAVRELNGAAVELALEVRAEFEHSSSPMPINGVVGPRGDGYVPGELQSADEARAYHSAQIEAFAEAEADLVTALTMNYVDEAIGVARAARDAGMPVAISFTLETDGRLVTGDSLQDAIAAVDDATEGAPVYYMVNCCHPTHLPGDIAGVGRLRGYRSNASSHSHAELDESEVLDAGDPEELGAQVLGLRERMPNLSIVGGCCGTDIRHLRAIADRIRA